MCRQHRRSHSDHISHVNTSYLPHGGTIRQLLAHVVDVVQSMLYVGDVVREPILKLEALQTLVEVRDGRQILQRGKSKVVICRCEKGLEP